MKDVLDILGNVPATTAAIASLYPDVSGINQKVSALEVDGIVQRAGLYGSSESIAQYKRNDLFAGSGLLKVGEPIGLTVVIR